MVKYVTDLKTANVINPTSVEETEQLQIPTYSDPMTNNSTLTLTPSTSMITQPPMQKLKLINVTVPHTIQSTISSTPAPPIYSALSPAPFYHSSSSSTYTPSSNTVPRSSSITDVQRLHLDANTQYLITFGNEEKYLGLITPTGRFIPMSPH